MMHNAMNIGLVYTILNEIEEYDYNSYMKVLNTITIPGRCETYNFNNRKIIISYGLDPELVNLKKYKDNKQINKILVVTGASGLGHKTWGKEFSSDEYIEEKMEGMSFAYNYIQKYADYVYITSSDSGATNKEELINHQSSLVTKINKQCYENRKYAIFKAISDAEERDVVLISGRGNRKIMCDGYDSISFLLDKDVVEEVINDAKGKRLW
jgi:UDP-N-acetylmuramoyl-L-alanyl-D-glutamate--2,6-diaminopimelate ligase